MTIDVKQVVDEQIAKLNDRIHKVNKTIHQNPELAYQEFKAHDTLCDFLEECGFKVTRHAYGLETAFEALYGQGGRLININCEYDALPLGHACGHNLISTAGITAFLALTHVLKQTGTPGRVQILGTPAEEHGGGKIKLIEAGAYKGVDASFMAHAIGEQTGTNAANMKGSACGHLSFTFKGKPAHAGANPWDGINALDAFVAFYNNVSLLRQQCTPDARMHGCLIEGPKVPNIIPEHAKVNFNVRANNISKLHKLIDRVIKCAEAASLATGCKLEVDNPTPYYDMITSDKLDDQYLSNLKKYGLDGVRHMETGGSTDQGNVSYEVPNIHAMFLIPGSNGNPHQEAFVADAGTEAGHKAAVTVGKSLALTAYDVLTDDKLYDHIHAEWKANVKQATAN